MEEAKNRQLQLDELFLKLGQLVYYHGELTDKLAAIEAEVVQVKQQIEILEESKQ